MVYNRYGLVFIAIPKCATTKVHELLSSKDLDIEGTHEHVRMVDLEHSHECQMTNYNKHTLIRYHAFTIVRNPYDRIWSAWKHLNLKNQTEGEDGMIDKFREFIKTELTTWFGNPDKFGLESNYHFIPQVDWIYSRRRYLIVDTVMRFETLQEDWKSFSEWYSEQTEGRLELPWLSPTDKSNATISIDEDPYDDECRRIVKKLYSLDFKLLDYE